MSENKIRLISEDGKKVYILSGSDKKELTIVDESSNPPKIDSFDLVPPGKMDNIDTRIDDLTSQNASLTQLQLAHTSRNGMKKLGVCIDDAANSADWLCTGATNSGRDTTKKLFESGCIEFSLPVSGTKLLTKGINYDFTNVNHIDIAFWIEDQYNFDQIEVWIASTANYVTTTNNWTKYMKATGMTTAGRLHAGWNFIRLCKSQFIDYNNAGESWGVMRAMRIRLFVPATKFTNGFGVGDVPSTATKVAVGGVYLDSKYETPQLMINFDDSQLSMFTNGFPYMRSKGIRSTLFVCYNHIKEQTPTSNTLMNIAQHAEYYNAGNDLGCHSVTHEDMWSKTEAELIYEWATIRDFLISNGWTRAALIAAYPNARYNQLVLTVVKNLGFVLGRGRNVDYIGTLTPDEILAIPTREIRSTTTIETLQGWIDNMILYNQSLSIFTHGVYENPDTYNTDPVTFNAFIDYVVAKRDAGLIDVVTYSEFYNKLSQREITIPSIITT